MKKGRNLFIGAGFAALLSCNNQINTTSDLKDTITKVSTVETEILKTDTVDNKIELSHFRNIPTDIQGCSCYFSATAEKFKNQNYLFAADYERTAFISIGGQLVKLKLVSTNRAPDSFGDHDRKDVYSNDQYKVTVEFKYISANGDETWWNEGTIIIENNKGVKRVEKMVGECGC